jgi:hypothetical protein
MVKGNPYLNYFFVVSFLVVSTAIVSFLVLSVTVLDIVVSVTVVEVVSPPLSDLLPPQAAAETAITKVNTVSLNEFFMLDKC